MIELGIVFLYLSTYTLNEISRMEAERKVLKQFNRYVKVSVLLFLVLVAVGIATSFLASVYYLLGPQVLLVFYILIFLYTTYRVLRNV